MAPATSRNDAGSRAGRLPLFRGLLPFQPSKLPVEIVGGLTLAAVGLPQAMGYAKIIEVPVVMGLYTLFLPVLAFAIFGTSRHLVVAADSATAAMVASALVTAANPAGSPGYVALTGLVAVVCAAMLLAARLFRLGFLSDFLSRTVLTGFLTGVGIQVAVGQVHGMLGIEAGGGGFFGRMKHCLEGLGEVNPAVPFLALAVGALILALGRWAPRLPGALLVVLASIAASAHFGFAEMGIPTVGEIPAGLPHLGLPMVGWGAVPGVLEIAFSCTIVILAQSAATARAYAVKYREDFDADGDLLGLCAANLAAGAGGTFVVNGSPTQTATAESAGGRSQLAQVVAAAAVMFVLLFLTGPLAHLPEAVLATIVFLIGVHLVKVRPLVEIYRRSPEEFWVAVITAVTVVGVGVREGILLALVLSLLQHVKRGYRPPTGVIMPDPQRHWHMEPPEPGRLYAPGLLMYWFGGSLYYANAGYFAEEVRRLVERSPNPVRWFVLEAGTVSNIDFSAAASLRELVEDFRGRGVRTAVLLASEALQKDFDREGLTELIGAENFYYAPQSCIDACSAATEVSE